MNVLRRIAARISPDFAALVAIAFAWNARFLLDPTRNLGHDTFAQFTVFHTFYSQLATEGSLALWFPYCGFGSPSLLWQIDMFTPSSCGFMLVGSTVGIDDVLAVQKWSFFHETLIFLAGLFACATRLFGDRRVRFLVCVMGLGTVSWHEQIYSCLRILYLDPWMVWCCFRFRDTERPLWFWATGIVAVLSVVGAPPYFAGLHLLTLVCLALPFAFEKRSLLTAFLRPTPNHLLGAAAFGLLATAIGTALVDAVADVRLLDEQRSPDGRVSREVFLHHYARDDAFVLRSYVFGRNFRPDLIFEPNLYVAMATWPLCALALCGRPRREVLAVALPAVVLIALALDETVASMLHGFPLMGYFRYRLSALSIANLYLTLLAGFGLTRLFEFDVRRRRRFALIGGILLIGALAAADQLERRTGTFGSREGAALVPPVHEQDLWMVRALDDRHLLLKIAALGLGPAAALWIVRPQRPNAGHAIFAAVVAFQLVDLSFYRFDVHRHAHRIGDAEADFFDDMLRIRRLEYRPIRVDASLRFNPRGMRYNLQFQWEQVDPCRHATLLQVMSPLVADVFSPSGPKPDGATLSRIAGCEIPKLVFTNSVVLVDSPDEAREVLAERSGQVFAVQAPKATPPQRATRDASALLAFPVVSEFTANRLRCQVDAEADGWLFYADAWHPDWTAAIDGAPAELRVANGCFKAVFVPAGTRDVAFEIGGRTRAHALTVYGIGLAAFLAFTAAIGTQFARRADPPAAQP